MSQFYHFLSRAPLHGVFFFLCLSAAVSCDKKPSSEQSETLPRIEDVNDLSDPKDKKKKPSQPSTTVVNTSSPASSSPVSLRFTSYNVANWLISDRFDYDTKKSTQNAPKPDDEKTAVIDILSSTKPDVIGVCEIGTREDLTEIQQLLKAKGLDLPVAHFTTGIDDSRRLGLLSKYPIVATARPSKLDYTIAGKSYSIQRGVLDATVKTPDGRLWRFLGVHLKSKREVEDGDQNLMRINEAQLLRLHIDSILKRDPQARLICYGDFNDTRSTSPLRIVQGAYNSPTYIAPLVLRDSRGELWTHHWEREDIYSRIDYIHHSPALKTDVIREESVIDDSPNWRKASDHRAIRAAFR